MYEKEKGVIRGNAAKLKTLRGICHRPYDIFFPYTIGEEWNGIIRCEPSQINDYRKQHREQVREHTKQIPVGSDVSLKITNDR